jgi:hypothetical protein
LTLREPTTLGDVLRTAREARFIDLARVERDTKIKARYLAALEHGEYRELPGAVYVKGFLRNYGLYLGLEPQRLLEMYRAEQGGGSAERTRRAAVPQPRRIRSHASFAITPGLVATLLISILVLAFGAYLVGELLTFAGTPGLTISEPAGDLAGWGSSEYLIRGASEPNATIRVSGLRENPPVTAGSDGHFTFLARLLPGSNLITLVAHDPRTGRDSAVVRRTISVLLREPSPAPSGSGS